MRPLPNVKLKVFFSNFTMISNEYPPLRKYGSYPLVESGILGALQITLPQIIEGFTCVLLVLIKSQPWEKKRTKLDCYIDDIRCSQTYIRVCFHSSFLDCSQHTLPICIHPILACNIHTHLHLSKMDGLLAIYMPHLHLVRGE